MANSDFWRELAIKFREFQRKFGHVYGDRGIVLGRSTIGDWRLRSTSTSAKVEFEALARRGAMHLPNPTCPDLLTAWLEALALYDDGEKVSQIHNVSIFDGIERKTLQSSYNVVQRSANYCKVLESEALELEARESRRNNIPLPHVAAPAPETDKSAPVEQTVQAQIHRLRMECKWSIEQLAAKTGFDERTVSRHLSGKTTPYLRNLTVYEQAFSKALKREVVINKMP